MKKLLYFLPLMIILQGCAGKGTTMVLNAPTERQMARNYHLVDSGSTVGVESSAKRLFETEVNQGLRQANMQAGQDLEISYRFIQFDEGSRFMRYMAGGLGNAGEGEMTIEVTFKNRDKQEIGKINVGGKIASGAFGGSFDNAIEQAALQVVRYVNSNFRS